MSAFFANKSLLREGKLGGRKMINKAILFATNAHAGQTRKGTKIPFIVHPMEVGVIVSHITTDEEIISAAILHDTLEDCPKVTIEQIQEEFGEKIATWVACESEDKTKTWMERKQHTIEHLKTQCREVQYIALADKLANIRAIFRDHKQLGEEVWQRFRVKDPKKQGWYYRSLVESLKDLSSLDEYQEYKSLVEEVFGR